ncbi:uncharacterized protein LOC141638964 [Silene latifolia]|uniref:uncharacterized protein LOC141638964 n=1 Tax=Silene latifolia TaxID=37657 RepID=UPI003D77C569
MAKKAEKLFINSKKFASMSRPCTKEMISFLNCVALCQNNDEKCQRQKQVLGTCMESQGSSNKGAWASINHNLLRLNSGRK